MAERGIDILIQVRDQASATLKAIESNFAGFQGKLNGLASAVANIGNVMRGSLAGLGAAAGASGLTNLVQGVVNVGTQMQSLRTTMTVVTGSSEKAGEAFQFVRQTADRLGFDTAELAKSYVSLTAASQGTALAGQQTKEVFLAVATAGRTLGLSTDQMNGALLAVQQMMSKGTVQAEELRGQLGERLPGAFQIAARAMGVTTQELGKMLEQGRVMANDFLPKFAAQLQKELGGGVEAASQTAVAAFARFRNALTDMATSIAQSGVLDLLAQLANAFAWVLKQAQGSAAGIHEAVQTYQQSMVALSKMSALLPSADTAAMSEMYRQRSVLQTRLAGLTTGREAVQPGDLEGIERIRETTAALANLEDQIKQAEKAAQQLAEVDVMGAVTLPVDPLAWTKPLTEAQKTFETTQAKLYETLKTAGADSIEQIDQQLVGLRKRYSELVAQIIAVPEARKAEKPILAAQLADVRAAIQVYDEERKAIQKNTQERLAAAQKEADELKRRDKAAQDALVTARAGVAAATDGWEAAMRIRLEYEQTDPVMIERLVHLEREKRAQEALNKTAEERKKLYDDQLKIARDIVTEYQLVSSIPEQDRESERLRRRLSALEPDFRADVVIADEGRRQWLKTEEDAKANARDFLALQEQIAEALARIGFGEEEIARKERERYLLKAQALTTDEEALRVLMEQYDVLQRQSEEMAKQRESAQFMEDVREPVRPQPRTRREAYEQGLERMRETNVPQARIAEAQRLVEHRLAAETLNDVLEYSRDLAERDRKSVV